MWNKISNLKQALKDRATMRTMNATAKAETALTEAKAERSMLEKKAQLENQLKTERKAAFALKNPVINRALENAKARRAASKQSTGFVTGNAEPFSGSNAEFLRTAAKKEKVTYGQQPSPNYFTQGMGQTDYGTTNRNVFGGSLTETLKPKAPAKKKK